MQPKTKRCRSCNEVLPMDMFSRSSSNGRYRSICEPCRAAEDDKIDKKAIKAADPLDFSDLDAEGLV